VSSPAIPSRFAAVPGRALATLGAVAAALIAAFVVAPPALAGGSGGGFADERHLTDAVRAAFVGYWRSGSADFPPGLGRIVDYWFHFHVIKAAVSAILLMVLIALGVLLWKAFLRGGGLGTGKGADVQAQPGALPDRLGGEERLEDPPPQLLGMPGPVSPISTSARSPSRAVRTVSVPSPAIASSALSMRLVQTWLSSAA
jgi:hypothetical protein